MKTFLTVFAAAFLIWRIDELSNTIIHINALTFTLWALLIATVFYVLGFNALHLKLINLYERFVGWIQSVAKHVS
jgi:hypothetical protein